MRVNKWTALSAVTMIVMAALPAAAQNPIIPLNTLVANQGTLSAGGVTFSNFQMPTILPDTRVAVFLVEFNDIGVTTVTNPDGTGSLKFVGIDPTTGLASPLIAGEFVRLVSYTATVVDPTLRMHSVTQTYGPNSVVTTNATLAYNMLFGVEPPIGGFPVFDPLRYDYWNLPVAGPIDQTLLPGGNLQTYNMENEFGFLKGHLGFPPGGTIDYISVNFSVVPAGSPVPPVAVNLPQVGDPVYRYGWTNGFGADPTTNLGQFMLTNFAQDGGAAISLTSSNPAALAVPLTINIPQGYFLSAPFALGPPTVDFPTDVTLTASFNGRTQTQVFTATPPTPFALASLTAYLLPCGFPTCNPPTVWLTLALNRPNSAAEVVTLTSSNPAVCPVPATLTLPQLSPADGTRITVICKPTGVDSPVTFTATLNGVGGNTVTSSTLIPKVTDSVTLNKAELVVKNLSLKVEASGSIPNAVITLYNAANGNLIGTMTQSGLSGTGAKYSFQGTLTAPVQTLLLKSTLNGTTTGPVSQK